MEEEILFQGRGSPEEGGLPDGDPEGVSRIRPAGVPRPDLSSTFKKVPGLVKVDPGQISHVIHNLVLNADQALPDGGGIEMRAENVEVSPGFALTLEPGN